VHLISTCALFMKLKMCIFYLLIWERKSLDKDLMSSSLDLVNLLRSNINRWITCYQQCSASCPFFSLILALLIFPALSLVLFRFIFLFPTNFCFLICFSIFFFPFHLWISILLWHGKCLILTFYLVSGGCRNILT
jgi:hypothetical protein